MATVYEFEGNLVRKVTREVTDVGRVSDMLPTLMTYHPVEMGRLPKDTAYLMVKPDAGHSDRVDLRIIIQQPPQVHEVLFNESAAYPDTQQAYKLAMPYFNFWFHMQGTPVRTAGQPTSFLWAPRSWGIFWMKRPFAGLTSPAISAKMPNSWGDTRVCFGNNPITANMSLGDHIDALINTYWGSVFNTDLDVYTPYSGRPRTQLNRWEAATDRNNDCWLNWSQFDQERPISELIENVAGVDAFMQPAPDSVEPVVPVPPTQRTWYAIDQWVNDSLDEQQRTRLRAALTPSE